MASPYNRIYNFSAGPCTLPVPVLEEAREDLLNYKGTGMSVMEMSHRSKQFGAIMAAAEADFRSLLGVPSHYRVLFLQGGASTQFAMVPMNFLQEGQIADYVTTGFWGAKALEAAHLVGLCRKVWDGKENNYNCVPDMQALEFDSTSAYIHFTSNETIQGVQFKSDPALVASLVCDMSSDILSRPVDIENYAMIYAGAQKNMGPAGVTVVVASEDFIESRADGIQPIFDYSQHAANDSMQNTPPCWSIYMCGLVYKHMLATGGVVAAQALCSARSSVLYAAIDGSGGFYRGHAAMDSRSMMNVTFSLPTEELSGTFAKEAEKAGLDGLKGHRALGGIRASIYNAFPLEGCVALADFMGEFAKRNG